MKSIQQTGRGSGRASYRPEAVLAELDDGSRVAALCFNLPEAPGLGERNDVYAQRLRDLAGRLDLPATSVEGIG